MSIIQIPVPDRLPDEAAVTAEVAAGGILGDPAAVAIASWWAEPADGGRALLDLAASRPVGLAALTAEVVQHHLQATDPADKATLGALRRWVWLHRQWAALDRWVRCQTAAWLSVAGLTGPAAELRQLPEVTARGGASAAVAWLEGLTGRLAAVENAARQRALADMPGSAPERVWRTCAELGASMARGQADCEDSPVSDWGLMPGAERLVEVSSYVMRCASRAAGWRLAAGLPPVLAHGGEGHVADLLTAAYEQAADEQAAENAPTA